MHMDSYAPRWIGALEKRSVSVRKCDFLKGDVIDQLRGADGAMWHFLHSPDDRQSASKVLAAIEHGLAIPVFPNTSSCWHYDEKIAQHYLLETIGAPVVKTWVFWDIDTASSFIRSCRYPVVFKLSVGAGSSNVVKIDSFEDAEKLAEKMFRRGVLPGSLDGYTTPLLPRTRADVRAWLQRGRGAMRYLATGEVPVIRAAHHIQKNYLYLQEFLPGNAHDIRITVIGNRAFGYIRKNRPDDFRASGSGNFDVEPANIDLKAVRIAHSISRQCGFQSMAYDFLYDQDEQLRINEMSYCYVNHMVRDCPGYWDRELAWHEGNMWPEEAHVEDFLYLLENQRLP